MYFTSQKPSTTPLRGYHRVTRFVILLFSTVTTWWLHEYFIWIKRSSSTFFLIQKKKIEITFNYLKRINKFSIILNLYQTNSFFFFCSKRNRKKKLCYVKRRSRQISVLVSNENWKSLRANKGRRKKNGEKKPKNEGKKE